MPSSSAAAKAARPMSSLRLTTAMFLPGLAVNVSRTSGKALSVVPPPLIRVMMDPECSGAHSSKSP